MQAPFAPLVSGQRTGADFLPYWFLSGIPYDFCFLTPMFPGSVLPNKPVPLSLSLPSGLPLTRARCDPFLAGSFLCAVSLYLSHCCQKMTIKKEQVSRPAPYNALVVAW